MVNTKGEGEKAGDDFWTKAERLLYMAYIGLIYYEAPKSEQNFETLLMLINMSETREEDENFKNAVDLKFEDLEKENPHHFAVLQYKKYKLAAGKTAKSILISCGARLAPFDIKEVRDLVSYDEMELDLIGDRLTALFVIIPDTDSTFNFIVAMMYTQMFNLLCTRADDVHNGKLPYHVRCLLDEFANIGSIPQFEKLIATIRSREISASIILQAQSQLKAIYKDHTDTIVGNCDTTLFLGGKEKTTLKDLSDALGKETIELFNTGKSFSQTKSSSINYQKTGRDLMTFDEISVMENDMCILQIRGLRPFYSKKVDIVKHKRYKLLSDYDKKNKYDVTKELNKVKNLEKIIANLEFGIMFLICFSDVEGDIEYEVKKMELEEKGLDTEENLEKIKEKKYNPKESDRIMIALIWALAIIILNMYVNGQLQEITEDFKKLADSYRRF